MARRACATVLLCGYRIETHNFDYVMRAFFRAIETPFFLGRASSLSPARFASSFFSLVRLIAQVLKDPSFAHLRKVGLSGYPLILSNLVHNRFKELTLLTFPARC